MARASHYLADGHIYHLTHRCHNRDHYLRFVRDRDLYRQWLWEGIRRHGVSVYGFCVTHNHAHVIAHADSTAAISEMMHLAAGAIAKHYNLRKKHLGSVWEHPYHCTIVEEGDHLFHCLCYVDLNMVRAGAVGHPREWRWCGYHELMGLRKRYRMLDIDRLLALLGTDSVEEFRRCYAAAIDQKLAADRLCREPHWTESLAVGSANFVKQAQRLYRRRQRFELTEVKNSFGSTWTLRESGSAYTLVSGAESGSNVPTVG